jgi:hypothetical protein
VVADLVVVLRVDVDHLVVDAGTEAVVGMWSSTCEMPLNT